MANEITMSGRVGTGVLTLIMGTMGQLIGRGIWYGCSMDKAWLLLFAMPPLSIVPAFFFFLNKVEPSIGCAMLFDYLFLVIPFLIGGGN